MAKTRIPLENKNYEEPVIVKFPYEIVSAYRKPSKHYDGVPTLSLEAYRTIKQNQVETKKAAGAESLQLPYTENLRNGYPWSFE